MISREPITPLVPAYASSASRLARPRRKRSIPTQMVRSACPTTTGPAPRPTKSGRFHRFQIISPRTEPSRISSASSGLSSSSPSGTATTARASRSREARDARMSCAPCLVTSTRSEMTSSITAEWPPQTTRDTAPLSSGSSTVIASWSRPNTSPNSWLTSQRHASNEDAVAVISRRSSETARGERVGHGLARQRGRAVA